MLLTTREVSEKYHVTPMAVNHWVKSGLKFKMKREIGRKAYRVYDEKDVEQFLNIGVR